MACGDKASQVSGRMSRPRPGDLGQRPPARDTMWDCPQVESIVYSSQGSLGAPDAGVSEAAAQGPLCLCLLPAMGPGRLVTIYSGESGILPRLDDSGVPS